MKKNPREEVIRSEVLFELWKSKKQKIRCSLGRVKSTVFIDLRIFYEDSVTGSFEASRSGFTFQPEVLPDLIMKLEEARAAIFKK